MNFKQKFRLHFLYFAGYFYFGFILLSLTAVIALCILAVMSVGSGAAIKMLIKIGIPIFIFGWAVFRGFLSAIFTRLPEPEGIPLNKKKYIGFYKIIEDIRRNAKCPRIHSVKVSLDFNAFISEQPRLGVLGWYKRYLVIGLPLLLVLTEQELKAVIAHECGHLSKAHGKTSVKIYRAQNIWERIAAELRKQEKDRTFFIRKFLHWYIPALNDMLFRMRKEHEYEADRTAAYVAGKQAVADSLVKLNVYEIALNSSFWPELYKMNNECANPPEDLFFRMKKAIGVPLKEDFTKPIIDSLVSYRSLPSSTHPSNIERIEALGANVPKLESWESDALEGILGNQGDAIIEEGNKAWYEYVEEGWKRNYENRKDMESRLHQLVDGYNAGSLNEDELLERAILIERTEGIDKGLAALKEANDKYPESNPAKYHMGRILLYEGKDEGLELMKQVMEKDCQSIPDCCYEAVNYLCSKDDKNSAAEYYHYAVRFMETNEDVKKERESIRFSDIYIPHDLSPKTVEDLRNTLLKYKEIKKAYIVSKHLEISGKFPYYIICIKHRLGAGSKWQKIKQEIVDGGLLPWEYWVVGLNGSNRELEYVIDRIPGGRII